MVVHDWLILISIELHVLVVLQSMAEPEFSQLSYSISASTSQYSALEIGITYVRLQT